MTNETINENEAVNNNEAMSETSNLASSIDANNGVDDVHSADDSIIEEAATVAITQQPVDSIMLRKILEGAILAAGQPLTIARLLELFDAAVAPTKEDVLVALNDIATECQARGYELKEIASGWRFQVREELAPWVNRLWDEKPQKYSRALLETLALIAYRQPLTRGDIEEIRGVAVSSHIMKTLMEREWVKVVGHRDVPGRPSLYATTRQFLDYFNLKNLEDLPSLSEIRDLDELMNVLNLGDEDGLGEKDTDTFSAAVMTAETSTLEGISIETTLLTVVETEAMLNAEPEEFVDGEEAFETIENTTSSTVNHLQKAIAVDDEGDITVNTENDESNI